VLARSACPVARGVVGYKEYRVRAFVLSKVRFVVRSMVFVVVGRCCGVWVVVLMFVGVGVLCVSPAVAGAGVWVQVTCVQPDGAPAPVEGWLGSSYGGYGPYSGPSDTCDRPGGSLSALDSSAAVEAAYTGPMWVYTAPEGSVIAGGALTVSLTSPQGEAYVATPQNEYSQADVLVNCQFNEPCGSDGTETETAGIAQSFSGGTRLFAAALCVGPYDGATSCPAGTGGGIDAEISVHAADIELRNGSTPTGSGFGGSLLQAAASGIADVTFTAHDPDGPGVYRIIAELDGTVVYRGTPDTNGGRCASIGTDPNGASEFLYAQPCKQGVAVDIPLDTTRFANGTHRLKLMVQDAAGNTAVVYDGTISIANGSGTGIGPGSPLAVRGAGNGTNASDQARLTVRWHGTTQTKRVSGYGQPDRIAGRLTTTLDGQGISGARIDVYETSVYEGARTIRLAGVRTGLAGGWTLTLPRGVPSSELRFVYSSHQNDTLPTAMATLALRVRAGIALRIAPRVTSIGQRIHFSGVLHGGPLPPGGKQLILEASSGGGWVQFDTLNTSIKGRYRASYRFKFPGPVTYRFRVLCPHEADFPYLTGASNIVTVRER
jgi:hypothetical protein